MMGTAGKWEKVRYDSFRIEYADGRENWTAVDTTNVSGLDLAQLQKQLEEAESKISGQKISVRYIGKQTVWRWVPSV